MLPATDRDPSATVLKVDGIGAYDHVLRSAMLVRLSGMPGARALLPFVRLSYASPSSYLWFDNQGQRRTVTQAEGGEQGDPLMPLLFSVGIQGALEEVSTLLLAGEQLCAFLDDVYIVCQPGRVRYLYDRLGEALLRVAGIRLHQGEDTSVEQVPAATDQRGGLGARCLATQRDHCPRDTHRVRGLRS